MPAMTRTTRAANVKAAIEALPEAFIAADHCEHVHGPTDPQTLAAWEEVERLGATVHRQCRLLAGKSKGG